MLKYEYHSPLGTMTMLADDAALHGLWFNDQKYFGADYALDEIAVGQNSIIKRTTAWLDQYFAKQDPDPHAIPRWQHHHLSGTGTKSRTKSKYFKRSRAGSRWRRCPQPDFDFGALSSRYWQ